MIEKLKSNFLSLYQYSIDYIVITIGTLFIEPSSKTFYWID